MRVFSGFYGPYSNPTLSAMILLKINDYTFSGHWNGAVLRRFRMGGRTFEILKSG